MSGVNGPDIAAVHQLLSEVARTVAGHDRKLDGLTADVAELRETVVRHDRKLDDLAAGLASLREAVTHYHSSVIGHGILLSELDDRVRRIERHLKLEPAST
jgi:ABC-type transporter Mla subunit MlaD